MAQRATHQSGPALVTLREAARSTGLGLRQLRRARERGELPVYRVGGWCRVRWADVLAWLEAHRERRAEEP